jgi:pyruvate,water dikinase
LAAGIAEFFGHPQDIEWCRDESGFQIVQSRPISNLFPIPQLDDDRNHVFVSVGHQQMMTDAMAPLGLSVWQRTALRPMLTAGGRLFVDVTDNVIDPPGRSALLNLMGRSDPLVADALTTILDSGFLATPEPATPQVTGESNAGNGAEGIRPTPPPIAPHPAPPLPTDASVVADLIGASTDAIDRLRLAIEGRTGEDLIDFIESDIDDLKRELMDPRSHQVLAAGMEATWWLNDHLRDMLGVVNAADALAQSAPGNVTSEMGLDLLDVADVVRPHPAVLDELRASGSIRHLGDVSGGHEVLTALSAYLDRYGMRCVGEIDITRPRWAEDPDALVPMILANVAAFEPGAHERMFAAGEQAARGARDQYLHQIRALPDGESAAAQTAEHIARLRMFVGYREFPKYAIVSRFWIYKQALLAEAHRLVANSAIESADDIFFLSLEELRNTIRDRSADLLKIARRRRELEDFASLRAPRVLTSRGDMLDGVYRERKAPHGALPGIAASAGVVEGRARVLMRIDDGALDPGDILVTDHTDPSWSPLFVGAAGLVTRVGGQMSHGSVIAREYGLPAVVGVADATTEIRDHDRIRVNGTDGFVEVLERG